MGEAVTVIYALLIFLGLILPQSLGVVAYRYTKQKNIYIKVTTIIIAPVCFFLIAFLFWGNKASGLREAGNYVCGAFGAAAVYSTIIGTVINLGVAIILFFSLNYYWRKKTVTSEQTVGSSP